MKVSIKDIAQVAGVSHSTVSRALSNSPLLPEATRRRIQRIAQRKGYTPNAIARGLVTRRTHALGVIVTEIADPFAAQVVYGIQAIASSHRYRVFLGSSQNDPTQEVDLVRAMREWSVDGVVVASSRVGALYKPLLKEIGVPIVVINNEHAGSYIHSVAVDDIQGAELATRYLIEQGHRVIGHLQGPSDRISSQNRLTGYRRALAKAKIKFNPSLVAQADGNPDGGAHVSQFLSCVPAPTAIFCYNDLTAIGALRALKECGVAVPRDISLIGFDDIPFAQYSNPALTTIQQPMFEMGQRATQMALALIEDDRARVPNVVIQGKLIVRESTRKK